MALISNRFHYALTTNSTSTGFTAQNATTTEPSGAGVFDLFSINNSVGGAPTVPKWIKLIPFGKDGADDTFDMRLYGYNATEITGTLTSPIYIPQLLVDISVVLSAITFTDHAANTFLADTITVNDGAADNADWLSLVSPAEDLVANVIVSTRACRYIKFDWDLAGGQEGVSMNCLFAAVDEI